MLRDDDLALVQCDSLDLGDVSHNHFELCYDAFLYDDDYDDNLQDDENRNDGDDAYAMCGYNDDNYDNLSMRSDDNNVDSNPNTKANDKLHMLATKTNRILQDELHNAVQLRNYRHKCHDCLRLSLLQRF